MLKIIICALGLALSVSAAALAADFPVAKPEDVGLQPLAITHLDDAMTALVDSGHRAGVIWAVAKDGKLVTHKAAGLRDIENALPMQTDTWVRYYSMTRAVTAVAVMMMYEEGKFALDDPVANFIPAFTDTQVLKDRKGDPTATKPQTSPLTVYHLLTYTSGLGYPFDYDPSLDVGFDTILSSGITIEQGVNTLASKPLLFQPGTHWYYGFSGDVLGRLVEVWSGQRYDEFLQSRIFKPLGLTDIGFQLADGDFHKLAKVYRPDETGKMADATAGLPPINSFRAGDTIFSGGGGLAGTALDYLAIAQLLLNGGELKGVRLLKPETVALITRNHLTEEQGPLNWYAQGRFTKTDPWRRQDGYGWGLSIGVRIPDEPHTIGGGRGEFTWDGFANTTFFADPENGIVAIALSQYLGPNQDELVHTLRTALYGALGD